MSIYFDPHGNRLHMKHLEHQVSAQNYDHFQPQFTGWRAERKAAEIAAHEVAATAHETTLGSRSGFAQSLKQIARNFLGLSAAG